MNSSEKPKVACDILLPEGNYKLFCWKVRNGSAVRAGETVALAVEKDAVEQNTAAVDATIESKPQHKRPTKRRRPGVNPPSETTESHAAKPSTANSSVASSQKNDRLVPIFARADGIVRMGSSSETSTLMIGYIEECAHPTVVDSLCAVCGKPLQAKAETLSQQKEPPLPNMSRVTVSGLTVTVSEEEGQRMAQLDAERLRKQRKLSLVLDLDHTLVHATNDIRAGLYLDRPDVRCLILPMMEEGWQQQVWMQHFVKLRPDLKTFLESALDLYEIVVYTAGTRHYAEQICIMLARHLVGTPHDQMDLDRLRHKVFQTEQEMQRNKEKTEAKEEEQKTASNMSSGLSEEAEKEPSSDVKDSSEANGGKKRKRVTFGETPPDAKSDRATEEELVSLRMELQEAERLEAEAVDLRQRLFGSRVVSRTDVGDLGRDVKSLRRIFPCGGTMAVVIDDREDVWANAGDTVSVRRGEPPENMLLVRPYHWEPFLGFADVNNPSGEDISGEPAARDDPKTGHESDEQLLWMADILKRIHKRYYESYNGGTPSATVPDVVREIRGEVLKGAKIVLSGLVPLHKQHLDDPTKPRSNVVRYTENMGATLQSQVTATTTHVVAANDGTDKILAARRVRGCLVVQVSWLMDCLWSLTRRDEREHLLGPAPRTTVLDGNVRPLVDSKRDNSSSSSEDEDNDLAAEFENELMNES